jgi:glycosyltransferase involved in cell wall biosynthesis/Tfp pilus assembly protein PilF
MALRLSKPATAGSTSSVPSIEALPTRGRALLATGDLAGYRGLFAEASREPDLHMRYGARRELLQAGLTIPRASTKTLAHAYLAVATEGLAILDDDPAEPVLLNLVGVALYELGALAGAKALFEAAKRLDPQLPNVKRNLDEVARRRKSGWRPRDLPAAVTSALRALEADARKVADRARPATGLTLTLCMIVRDEESMLRRCLDAVRDAVDEIVVVDTGSTDKTVEIAESYGAKVHHHEWTGDFSAARNASFDAATSDWIVYLDADEVLYDGEAERLRALTGRTWREAFFVVEDNHTGALEDGTSVHHNALRVFRNRPEYRFKGRIHEQIAHSLPGFLVERIESTDVRLEHFGYLGVVREEKDKSRRNLELLERQLDENGETTFLRFNLGSEYAALGEHATGLEHFVRAWELLREEDDDVLTFGFVPSLASRMAAMLRVNRRREDLKRHVDEAMAIYPGFTDLVFELAMDANTHSELDAAKAYIAQCLEMGDAPSAYSASLGHGSFVALTLLSEIHRREGDLAAAEDAARRALAANPRFLNAVEPLAQALLEQDVPGEDVAATLHELVEDDTPAMRFLLAVPLYEAGAVEPAERELRGVLERQPHAAPARAALAEALLSQCRYAEAAEVAAAIDPAAPLAPAAVRSELFARLAGGAPGAEAAFTRARDAGLAETELTFFRAWQAIREGAQPPALGRDSADLLMTVLEALLRVQDVDAFVPLLALTERVGLSARERREQLAQMYFRRGFVESAADEWAASCEEDGPSADALTGLAAIAVVRGDDADAKLFAHAARELDPGHAGAARVLARLAE